LAGILLIGLFLKLLSREMELLKDFPESSEVIYYRGVVWLLIMPVMSLVLGSYFFIQSLRKSKILRIVINQGQFNIRIKEFEERDTIQDLILFINKKLPQSIENAF
jgi:hypothetical protein